MLAYFTSPTYSAPTIGIESVPLPCVPPTACSPSCHNRRKLLSSSAPTTNRLDSTVWNNLKIYKIHEPC